MSRPTRDPITLMRALDRRMLTIMTRKRAMETIDTTAQDWIASSGADAVALYERDLVPRIFGPFARRLVEAAALAPEDRVLDLGCGTGIVARTAAALPGGLARIAAVDLAPRFLAVARASAAGLPIEWLEGDAQDLSAFADDSFDVVLSQQAFQFVPDRSRAAAEMRRVLAPGGRALVSVWTDFDETPGHVALAAAIEAHAGAEAAAPMRSAIYGLSDAGVLERYLRDAGFAQVTVVQHRIPLPYGTAEEFARSFAGAMLEDAPPETLDRAVAATIAALQPLARPDGGIALPMTANVAVARG